MNPDLKRIIVTAALAAAAFNATVPVPRAAVPTPGTVITTVDPGTGAVPAADRRPRRIRIERCAGNREDRPIPAFSGPFTTI